MEETEIKTDDMSSMINEEKEIQEIGSDSPNYMETLLNYQQQKEMLNREEISKGLMKLQSILQGIFIVSSILIWIFVGFKGFLLTCSIFSILMYFNITLTSLANAFIGRGENTILDIVWRILFMLLASIGFGIYFNI